MYPLTGCPQHSFLMSDLRDIEGFWKRLLQADRRGFPATCCTFSQVDKDVGKKELYSMGLQDSHAYTLIGAKEIV